MFAFRARRSILSDVRGGPGHATPFLHVLSRSAPRGTPCARVLDLQMQVGKGGPNVTQHTAVHPETPEPAGRFGSWALLAMTAALVGLCVLVAVPFLPAITWGVALAIMAFPLHRW